MRLLPIIASLLFFSTTYAQEEYVIIDQPYDMASNEFTKKITDANYETSIGYFINGYLTIKKKDQSTFVDSSGNILDKLYDFKTNMSSNKIFFIGKPITGINDYGKKEEDKYIGIQSVDANGNPIDSEINSKSEYYFSSNMSSVYDHYLSKDTDYFTIHYNKPDPSKGWGYSLQEGLINGKGNIILKPEYLSVKQIVNDYFILTKEDDTRQVMNLKDMSTLPVNISSIYNYRDVQNVRRLDDYLSFNDKIIAKDAEEKAWGIYDLAKKKWNIPASYQELRPISMIKQLDDSGLKHLLFTDAFIAKKDDKWGVVDNNNVTIIPFEFSKINFNGSFFEVFDANNRMNFYDVATKSLLFDIFYDKIQFDPSKPVLAILTLNNLIGIYDYENKAFIVEPSEGYKSIQGSNKHRNYLLERKNAEGKSDMALFSIAQKKIILAGFNDHHEVDRDGKFSKIKHYDGTSSLIDNDAKEIVPPGKYYGRPQYQQGIIFFYEDSSKRAKAVHCYKSSGEPVDASTCAEKFSKKKKK